MLDNVLILVLFMGMIATVVSLLSPLFFLYLRKEKLLRQEKELQHIKAKHEQALAIYNERKAQGRI